MLPPSETQNTAPSFLSQYGVLPYGMLSPPGHVQQLTHVSPHLPIISYGNPNFEAMEHSGIGYYDSQGYHMHGTSYDHPSQLNPDNTSHLSNDTGSSLSINEDNQNTSFNNNHEEEEDHPQQGPGMGSMEINSMNMPMGVNMMMPPLGPMTQSLNAPHQSGGPSFSQSGLYSFPYSINPVNNPYPTFPQSQIGMGMYPRFYIKPPFQNQNQYGPNGGQMQYDEESFQKSGNMGMNMPFSMHQGIPMSQHPDHQARINQNNQRRIFNNKNLVSNQQKQRKDDLPGQVGHLKNDSNPS